MEPIAAASLEFTVVVLCDRRANADVNVRSPPGKRTSTRQQCAEHEHDEVAPHWGCIYRPFVTAKQVQRELRRLHEIQAGSAYDNPWGRPCLMDHMEHGRETGA